MTILKKIFLYLIKVYQNILSPDHNRMGLQTGFGACRYYPSCSEYTRQAIIHYGPIKGIIKGFARILRCHPLAKGGYDPLKEEL